MKQWVVENKDNSFDGLTFKDTPLPTIGKSEVLVKLQAASLNYRDLIIPLGKYPFPSGFPIVPGSDGASEVIEVGSKVTEFKKGDKVATLFNQGHQYGPIDIPTTQTGLGGVIDGTIREYSAFAEKGLVKAAKNLSPVKNSTLTYAALTSWNALYDLRPLKPGQVVLVQGTGGVSIFALQFAKAAGAIVIATTSSNEKAKKLKQLDSAGVDHIIEVGRSSTLKQSFKAIKFEGVISMIGFLGGVSPADQPSVLDTLSNICTVRDWTALPLHETKQSAAPLLSGNATEYSRWAYTIHGTLSHKPRNRLAMGKPSSFAVWHTLFGYWGGISPNSDLARKYKTKEVQVKDPSSNGPIAQNIPEGKILTIDPNDIQRFYEEFYSYLNTVGVDSVKTDAQFFLDLLENYGIWALEDFIYTPGYLFRRSYALQHQPAVGLSAVFLEQMPGYILAVVAAVVGLTQNYPPAR
ncbi:hypothetical protein DTO012A9_9942 [Penicillium roqueforti]|nr:hypothetical protein DTO012A9_9942 [Penicillium roqueforti]KAI3222966.1 hypothetical protein CBS147310_9705 [Penicillium roqueforti]